MSDDRLSPREEGELIDLTRKLVSIPSTASDDASIYDYVRKYLRDQDLDPFGPTIENPYNNHNGLENVYARTGDGDGPKIHLNCHLDTVNLRDGWFHDPFGAVEEDGKIFGLGAADMKGGCAAAICAYQALLQRKGKIKGDLFLSCVFGEEAPQPLGTDTLLREYDLDGTDLIIVTEPSPLVAINDHCTVHKRIHKTSFPVPIIAAEGRVIFEIDFYGKASHASHPSQGINALHDAARVISELARFDLFSHIKMGRGHYVVLNIDGGDQSFTVPSKCRIVVNRQLTLGENDKTVLKELKRIIRSLKLKSKFSIRKRHSPSADMEYKPYFSESNRYTELFLKDLPKKKIGRGKPKTCTFATSSVGDFNLFGARTNSPVMVFGPGGGNIHAPNEYVTGSDIIYTANHLLRFFMDVF